jgi:hypothetical protein
MTLTQQRFHRLIGYLIETDRGFEGCEGSVKRLFLAIHQRTTTAQTPVIM